MTTIMNTLCAQVYTITVAMVHVLFNSIMLLNDYIFSSSMSALNLLTALKVFYEAHSKQKLPKCPRQSSCQEKVYLRLELNPYINCLHEFFCFEIKLDILILVGQELS